jgi:hypothetical protein
VILFSEDVLALIDLGEGHWGQQKYCKAVVKDLEGVTLGRSRVQVQG